MHNEINQAIKVVHEGGIIAYPTEGVFGLGCDPFNETAVLRLLKIKRRSVKKGLILITSSWSQVKDLVKMDLCKSCIIKPNNKKPITWVFPATKKVPYWVSGKFASVAIRVTLHPIAKKLCQKFGGSIISTSANAASESPAKNAKQVSKQFGGAVDFIISGRVGNLKKSTEIRDVITNKLIRG
ncbi:Threonylcarbamoyl-AMP synthase [Gammaproteobacteria bacterium]